MCLVCVITMCVRGGGVVDHLLKMRSLSWMDWSSALSIANLLLFSTHLTFCVIYSVADPTRPTVRLTKLLDKKSCASFLWERKRSIQPQIETGGGVQHKGC